MSVSLIGGRSALIDVFSPGKIFSGFADRQAGKLAYLTRQVQAGLMQTDEVAKALEGKESETLGSFYESRLRSYVSLDFKMKFIVGTDYTLGSVWDTAAKLQPSAIRMSIGLDMLGSSNQRLRQGALTVLLVELPFLAAGVTDPFLLAIMGAASLGGAFAPWEDFKSAFTAGSARIKQEIGVATLAERLLDPEESIRKGALDALTYFERLPEAVAKLVSWSDPETESGLKALRARREIDAFVAHGKWLPES